MRKRACTEVSKIMGARPKKVVTEVSRMGRKRRMVAWTTASWAVSPSARSSLILTTSTRESLTAMPARATRPMMEMMLRS
jgi:hypothetical protein